MKMIDMTLNQLAAEVHALAKAKGWHTDDGNEDAFVQRMCNNLHDEVSELHEAWRNNRLRENCDKTVDMRDSGIDSLTCLEEELADIIIRTLDDAGRLGVDIGRAVALKHAFNKTRPIRHGGKRG
jgi:NTP pyrophosphatase (non-canonical NTP hydrolase)